MSNKINLRIMIMAIMSFISVNCYSQTWGNNSERILDFADQVSQFEPYIPGIKLVEAPSLKSLTRITPCSFIVDTKLNKTLGIRFSSDISDKFNSLCKHIVISSAQLKRMITFFGDYNNKYFNKETQINDGCAIGFASEDGDTYYIIAFIDCEGERQGLFFDDYNTLLVQLRWYYNTILLSNQ